MDYRDLSGPSWGRSSVGRAPALQAGGQEFESPRLHHLVFNTLNTKLTWIWVSYNLIDFDGYLGAWDERRRRVMVITQDKWNECNDDRREIYELFVLWKLHRRINIYL